MNQTNTSKWKSTGIIIFVTVIVHASTAFSQTILTGNVTNADLVGFDCINVYVCPIGNPRQILGSTLSDETGRYELKVNSAADSLLINVSGMEIAKTSVLIPNRSGNYDIEVEQKTTELREVVVQAKKIYSHGDTINYNVASFLSANDQSVADVLRKMPGITVSDAGQISYKGKPIKNFYIEGLDLMKGRYGIATNNIDPNNISTVQVLENHQDIQALKGLRPEEQASINLKLKEGVKGVFNLIATLGGGYGDKFLWNNSAIVTYFRRNSQLLATYKGNNSGEDLAQDLYSFDNDYSRTNALSTITMPSAPGIDKRFYYFNKSHSATYNNVYRIGREGELGINAAYLSDYDDRSSANYTTYTLPDGGVNIIDEAMRGVSKTQKVYGDITYMSNGKQDYLKEQLKFDWSDNYSASDVFAGTDISQWSTSRSYRLINKFHLTHHAEGKRGVEVISLINLEKRPHSLSVTPNLFPQYLTGDCMSQNAESRNISTENSFGLLSAWRIGKVNITPGATLNYQYNTIQSDLENYRNNLALDYLDVGMGAEISYNYRKVYLSCHIPLKYQYFKLNDRIDSDISNKSYFHVEPKLSFRYKVNTSHEIGVSSSLNYSVPSITNLYSHYILTSYRQLSSYDVGGIYESSNIYTSLTYNYKDILAMRFAGLDLSWMHQKPEVMYGYRYDGDVERIISRRCDETSDMYSMRLRGSQGFDWRRLKIGVELSYSHFDNPLLVQDQILRYSSDNLGANLDISLSLFNWLDVAYTGKYYQSASKQRGYDRMPWLRTVSNNASLTFNLPGNVSVGTSLYHYYNNMNDGDKSFLLLNAEARYSIKRWSFTLSCDNLLNRKSYVYSNLSALSESISTYSIRPRSVMLKIRFRIL